MSTTFVNALRTRGDALSITDGTTNLVHIRIEVPEVWETIKVNAPLNEPVANVKAHVLLALSIGAARHSSFVVKLNGFEVLDEQASLADAGVLDGSTLLITSRRRRPVR